jgi:hypothetical protein
MMLGRTKKQGGMGDRVIETKIIKGERRERKEAGNE